MSPSFNNVVMIGPHRPIILIACDQVLWGEALTCLLQSEFSIASLVFDGRLLLHQVERLQPALVLLDFTLPRLNGIDVAAHLHHHASPPKLIFITEKTGQGFIDAVFSTGGWGYVSKHDKARELIRAIHSVLGGSRYVSQAASAASKKDSLFATSQDLPALTLRQREIVQLIAEGFGNKEIAGNLNLSLKTIEFHRSAILRHLKLKSTADLTRYFLTDEYLLSIQRARMAHREISAMPAVNIEPVSGTFMKRFG